MEKEERFRYKKLTRIYTEKRRNPIRKTPRKSYPYIRIGSDEWFARVEEKVKILREEGKINGRKPKFSYYEICYKEILEKNYQGKEPDYYHYLFRLSQKDKRKRESNKKYFYSELNKERRSQQVYIHVYRPDLNTRNMSNEEITKLYLQLKEENKQKRMMK